VVAQAPDWRLSTPDCRILREFRIIRLSALISWVKAQFFRNNKVWSWEQTLAAVQSQVSLTLIQRARTRKAAFLLQGLSCKPTSSPIINFGEFTSLSTRSHESFAESARTPTDWACAHVVSFRAAAAYAHAWSLRPTMVVHNACKVTSYVAAYCSYAVRSEVGRTIQTRTVHGSNAIALDDRYRTRYETVYPWANQTE